QPQVIDQVPKTLALSHRICPVAEEDGVVVVALSDPMNITVLEDLGFMLNKEVKGAIASPESIDAAIERYYGKDDSTMQDAMDELGINIDEMAVVDGKGVPDLADLENASQAAP